MPLQTLHRLKAIMSKSRGDWKDGEGAEGFCKMYGTYFKEYVAPYQGLLVVEFCVSLCLAIFDF